MKLIPNGVCAPQGFQANGIHCGIRADLPKKDLALIVSQCKATAAAVYSTSLIKGAPLHVTKQNIADGYARAVICNSGNANTCNPNGIEVARGMCALVAEKLGMNADDVLVASTGLIGKPLSLEPMAQGMDELCAGLSCNGSSAAAQAIMTTDTVPKELAVEFTLGGKICRMGAIAKGSGMIHPNMATMLVFLTTDAAISSEMLQKALSGDIQKTFNMLSVDGDTSTNDMVTILANGMAGNPEITTEGDDFTAFMRALNTITVNLCRQIAGDGEGATKLLECIATGAESEDTAKKCAKSILCSSMVKAAMFGCDPECGWMLGALGSSGGQFDVTQLGIALRSANGTVQICEKGVGIPFCLDFAKEILAEKEIEILLSLGSGPYTATAWGCDLTYDYVKINGNVPV